MSSKVKVYTEIENDKLGIGIKVIDKKATVADLLESWQPLCDDNSMYKKYAANNYAMCKGCTINCCSSAYVIPDIISFKKMASLFDNDYNRFIKDYFQTDKVKNGLLRMQPEPCIFLKDNICSIYLIRSLICRFYICSDLLGETEQLIYSITVAGISATHLFAEQNGLLKHNTSSGMTSMDKMFKELIEEYKNTDRTKAFLQATEYSDIPLELFL
ncbi:hypothetical protein SYNTR_2278 [Candidatus Syntrophocurvum alkaliphilum]|uniref:YkgJ family cysteine cluster protein n=1 Tax=Candidatus Syntrophocurvum alkaliphilum TaxID=2293317 RepID=A0A6I6DEJ8_9FIRM|nr:YkgJ family cysteine cluster protein [Candidatus Syntrophocurvum alkaliphilum]QGU00872.1 hypothetical protein SYNTR_2278 [Candidatus Syntrophocurvum alkaliphilum]